MPSTVPFRRLTGILAMAIVASSAFAQDETSTDSVGNPTTVNEPQASIDDIFLSVFGKERPALAEGSYYVLIDGINVGEYRITPEDGANEGSIEADFVTDMLAPATIDDFAKTLKELTDGSNSISFQTLRDQGLQVEFDPQQLALRITLPNEIKTLRNLNLRGQSRRRDVEFTEPSDFSAFLSYRAGATVVEESAVTDTGFYRYTNDIDLAVNILNVVMTADLRYDSIRSREFSRGDVRLTYDDREHLIRYELGDLSVGRRPFQNAPRIAGIAAFRDYAINPYVNIRPTSEQAFELDRPARVEVLVNGSPVRTYDLPSGRFNLRDFPLIASAGNDIELRIIYGSGEIEIRSFPAFYDLELLAPGLVDFAFNFGAPYRDDNGLRRYDTNDYNGTAYARYGITTSLTAGLNWEGSRDFDLVGGEFVWASPIGTFGLNASTNIREANVDTSKFTTQYRWRDNDPIRERSIDVLMSLTGKDYLTLSEIFSGAFVAKEARLRVGQKFGRRTSAQFSIGYEDYRSANGDSYFAGVTASQQYRFGSLYAGIEYRQSPSYSGPAFRMGLSIPLGRANMTSSYFSEDNAARIEYNRLASVGVNSFGFSAGADRRDDSDRQFARATFLGNRFEASAQQIARNYLSRNERRDLRTEFFFGSALVMAGGQFAISPPVRNGFAIFKPDKKAGQYRIAAEPRTGFGSAETKYSAYSGPLGPAVVTSLTPYFNRSIQIDAPDAPAGTSLGGQVYEFSPGFKSGYRIKVGDSANVSVIGNMVDKDGDPLVYISGEVTLLEAKKDEESKPKQVFTNAKGRFFVEGVEAGRSYQVTVTVDGTQYTNKLDIPDDVAGLHRIDDYYFYDIDVEVEKEGL